MIRRGLFSTFVSFDDLAARVRTALQRDVDQLVGGSPEGGTTTPTSTQTQSFERPTSTIGGQPPIRAAVPRCRLGVSGTKSKHCTGVAEEVVATLEAASDGEPPRPVTEMKAERIHQVGMCASGS
jgi:hypothetical protein